MREGGREEGRKEERKAEGRDGGREGKVEEYLTDNMYVLQSLKHLLSGALQEFSDLWPSQ